MASQAYALEEAAELCEARGLIRELVFVLGRMGNAHRALHLIISRLADIPQACCSFLTSLFVVVDISLCWLSMKCQLW